MAISKTSLRENVSVLGKLEYKSRPFVSRNWGHPWHSLISYPSKLKPSIAYFLVKLFSSVGDTVLDPFSGVGTIPFEACLQGRRGVGSDISPLAFNATRAKIEAIESELVQELLLELESCLLNVDHNTGIDGLEPEIEQYYHPRTLNEILIARDFFLKHNNKSPELAFLLTCMLHILHGNRPYALSRRSHNIIPWTPTGRFVYKPVLQCLANKAQRMLSFLPSNGFKSGFAFQSNAVKLDLGNNTIDAILTSPPFHSSRDFLRMNRIRLWFCGWNYERQQKAKQSFLEHQSEIGIYNDVFQEFHRVLKEGSPVVLHLGVVGFFDMARNISPLAEHAGFEHIATVYEDTSKLERHGIRDQGKTSKQQFLILRS